MIDDAKLLCPYTLYRVVCRAVACRVVFDGPVKVC